MVTVKTDREIDLLRESCAIVRDTLAYVGSLVKPGVSTEELDKAAEKYIRMRGAEPSCLGYCGYPASICASVNEEVVHGIPGERILREGDLRLSLLLTKAGRWAEDFAAANPQFAGQVKVLQTILSGDYSSPARELAGEAEDGKADD